MMGAVDIRPQDLAIVRDILNNALPNHARVFVFGSRAKNTTKRGSDLDIAIDVGRSLTRAEALELADQFEESDLSYRVDIVDLCSVSDVFKSIVTRQMVPLITH